MVVLLGKPREPAQVLDEIPYRFLGTRRDDCDGAVALIRTNRSNLNSHAAPAVLFSILDLIRDDPRPWLDSAGLLRHPYPSIMVDALDQSNEGEAQKFSLGEFSRNLNCLRSMPANRLPVGWSSVMLRAPANGARANWPQRWLQQRLPLRIVV